jgi:hypothetical protein
VTEYNKAWAALIGAALTIAAQFGLPVDWATPELIATIGGLLTTVFVWLIPNKKPA